MKILLTTMLTLLLQAWSAHALGRGKAGTSAGEFLKIGADARGAAMGGEISAASVDAAAAHWNPAGLARVSRTQISFTHGSLYQSAFYEFASYAQPIKPLIPTRRREIRPSVRGTLSTAVLYLNAGPVNEVDNTGKKLGAFTPRDAAVIAAWGATFTERLDLGLALKYVDSRISAVSRTGTLDLGARYNMQLFDWPWVLAINARNLGGELRFREQAGPLPASVRFGQALSPLEHWTVTLDIVAPNDNDVYPAFGTELRMPVERYDVFLRGGWSGRTNAADLDGLAALSMGLGLGLEDLGFDYAWIPFGALGMTHRLSLTFRFK